jgi:hypothetical protein
MQTTTSLRSLSRCASSAISKYSKSSVRLYAKRLALTDCVDNILRDLPRTMLLIPALKVFSLSGNPLVERISHNQLLLSGPEHVRELIQSLLDK